MPTGKKYQGWASYETWAVALWIDNDEGSYRHWRGEAHLAARGHDLEDESEKEEAVRTLAERLKDEFESAASDVASGNLWGDLLSAAMSEVDWDEIAEHLLEE